MALSRSLSLSFDSQYNGLLEIYLMSLFLRCVCWDPMNFEFMISSMFLSMKVIWVFFWSLICMITYILAFFLRIFGLVRPTRSIFLSMERSALWWVRSYGAWSQWQKGNRHVCIVAIEDNKMGFISYCMNLSLYIMSSCLRRYSVFNLIL